VYIGTSRINEDYLSSVRREASRKFGNEYRGYLKLNVADLGKKERRGRTSETCEEALVNVRRVTNPQVTS